MSDEPLESVRRRISALQQAATAPDARCSDLVAALAQLHDDVGDIAARQRARPVALDDAACFDHVFQHAPIAVALTSLESCLLQVNPAFCTMLGYKAEELIGKSVFDITHPDDIPAGRALAGRIFAGDTPSYSLDKRYLRKDGEVVWAVLNVSLLRDPDGAPRHFVAQIVDITARKRAEASLYESDLRFEQAFEHAPVGMSLVGIDGRVLRVNRALCQMFGYSSAEMLTMPVWQITHPDDMPTTIEQLQHMLEGHQDTWELEKRFLHRDGRVVWAISSGSLVRAGDGRPLYVVSQVLDLTARRRTEATLREVEERFENAFRHAPIGMALVGLNGQPAQINRALAEMLGYDEAELLPKAVVELMHPDDWPAALAHRQRLIDGEMQSYEAERRYFHKSGAVVWAQMSVSLVRDDAGQPLYTISQMLDITERKRHDAALRRSEERFALAVAGAQDVIWDWDLKTGELYASPRWSVMLGLPEGAASSQLTEWLSRVHPDDFARVDANLRDHLDGRVPHYENEHRLRHADGSYRWVSARGLCVRDGHGEPYRMAGSLSDISGRKRTEEHLRQSELMFRTLAETLQSAILLVQGAQLRYVNPATMAITGYTREELLTMQVWDIVHPDSRELVRQRGRARRRGEPVPAQYEVKVRTRDGGERWVEVAGASFELEGQPAVLGTAFDITARKQAEAYLHYRLEFEKLLSTLASEFINLAPEQINAGIEAALQAMGEFAGVDRSFLAQFSNDGRTFDWTHLWSAPAFAVNKADYQCMPSASFPWALAHAKRSEVMVLQIGDALPPEAAGEREFLGQRGVRSLMQVPLVHCGQLVGFIGFSSLRVDKRWSGDELTLLRIAAEMFVNALQRKRAAEALQRSEERFALAVGGTNDGIWDWNVATTEVYFSPRWKRILGYDEDEISAHIDEWNRRMHPDDYERALFDLTEHIRGRTTQFESEHRLMHKDGRYRHVLARSAAVRAPDGWAVRMVGSLTDITARKQAEQEARQREAELAHVLRVTTMGEMASGLAHEINQPLAAIVNYAQRLRAPAARRRIRDRRTARGARADRRRIAARRRDHSPAAPVRAQGTAAARVGGPQRPGERRRRTGRVRSARSTAIACGSTSHPHLPRCCVDRIQIEQVILNLVRNGFEAMPTVRRCAGGS